MALLVHSALSAVDGGGFACHMKEPLAEVADEIAPGISIQLESLKELCPHCSLYLVLL